MSKGRHPKLGNVSMGRHAKSGVAHNHANSITKTREYNRQLEKEKELREKRKPTMFSKVKDLIPY